MARIASINRRDLIKNLRTLGFIGPHPGGRHQIMRHGNRWVVLPNPHGGDISAGLVARLLRQAGISREEWEKV
jgi:predicted RNA binding protein YcfA (HicA-like mRNA interferase family)